MSELTPVKKAIQRIAQATENLSDEEIDAIEAFGILPEIAKAAEFGWLLRTIAQRERERRTGKDVVFPTPACDLWGARESADNLMASVAMVDAYPGSRIADLAVALLIITGVNAAAVLRTKEITHAN